MLVTIILEGGLVSAVNTVSLITQLAHVSTLTFV